MWRTREDVAAACGGDRGPGGFILATVPSSCPYHADPLDTYYRPSPAELASAFARSEPLLAEEVAGLTYAEDLKGRGLTVAGELMRTVLWSLIFFVRPPQCRGAPPSLALVFQAAPGRDRAFGGALTEEGFESCCGVVPPR